MASVEGELSDPPAPTIRPDDPLVTRAVASASTGFTGKAKRPLIRTSNSSSFPSEIPTPQSASPSGGWLRHDAFKTPISPPAAYMDFLKAKPGGLASPPSSSDSSSGYSVTSSGSSTRTAFVDRRNSTNSLNDKLDFATKLDHPGMTRNSSTDSSVSYSTTSTDSAKSFPPPTSAHSHGRRMPSPRLVIPSGQTPRSASARTPHPLYLPRSPFSATSARSPLSARSTRSAYVTSATSSRSWSTSFSPRSPYPQQDSDKDAAREPVMVREVTTRTWTIRRTPLEPAPKGKRRKTVGSEDQPVGEGCAGAKLDKEAPHANADGCPVEETEVKLEEELEVKDQQQQNSEQEHEVEEQQEEGTSKLAGPDHTMP